MSAINLKGEKGIDNKILGFFLLFIFMSCSSTQHINIGSTYKVDKKDLSRYYVLYNAADILYLKVISKNEKIGVIDGKVVYVQCENKRHFHKYNIKEITFDDILVEPGVGFYVKLPDEWYGFIDDINTDLTKEQLTIKFIFKKESFSLVGDVHELMHYNDYLEWLDPSSFFYDDLNNKIIIAQ